MGLSQFDAAPIAHLSGLPFESRGAFPAEGQVSSTWIVEAVDVFEDCDLSITARPPGPLPEHLVVRDILSKH